MRSTRANQKWGSGRFQIAALGGWNGIWLCPADEEPEYCKAIFLHILKRPGIINEPELKVESLHWPVEALTL